MASGLNYYMREYLHMSVSWGRAGGNTTRPLTAQPPAVTAPVRVHRRALYSYYANVVTVSYSMVSLRSRCDCALLGPPCLGHWRGPLGGRFGGTGPAGSKRLIGWH
jgi:hypothetical protein